LGVGETTLYGFVALKRELGSSELGRQLLTASGLVPKGRVGRFLLQLVDERAEGPDVKGTP
jgi:hypothetical protein